MHAWLPPVHVSTDALTALFLVVLAWRLWRSQVGLPFRLVPFLAISALGATAVLRASIAALWVTGHQALWLYWVIGAVKVVIALMLMPMVLPERVRHWFETP